MVPERRLTVIDGRHVGMSLPDKGESGSSPLAGTRGHPRRFPWQNLPNFDQLHGYNVTQVLQIQLSVHRHCSSPAEFKLDLKELKKREKEEETSAQNLPNFDQLHGYNVTQPPYDLLEDYPNSARSPPHVQCITRYIRTTPGSAHMHS
ncbi:hypothetical protein Bbelb_167770 [Branchiostoma belcheri]|nr:hypothetical protein Bbelb_167770 [Branchiostoma belcheri]